MQERQDAPNEVAVSFTLLVLGAVLGAASALLLAPGSGSGLRTRVAAAVGDWREQTAETLARGRERIIGAVEQTQESGIGGASPPDKGGVRPT